MNETRSLIAKQFRGTRLVENRLKQGVIDRKETRPTIIEGFYDQCEINLIDWSLSLNSFAVFAQSVSGG